MDCRVQHGSCTITTAVESCIVLDGRCLPLESRSGSFDGAQYNPEHCHIDPLEHGLVERVPD